MTSIFWTRGCLARYLSSCGQGPVAPDQQDDGKDPADRPCGQAGDEGHRELAEREGGAHEDRVGVIQALT